MIRCPKCGGLTEPNPETHNLCQKCYNSTTTIKEQKRRIVYCGSCGKIKLEGRWIYNSSIEDYINQLATKENIISKTKGKIVYESIDGNKKILTQLQLERSLCPGCLTQKTDSYLFEVKVRVEGRAMQRRETIYLMESIRRTCLESPNQDFVYRFSDSKDGVDVLVSSKKVAEEIVSNIRKHFDGKLIQSYKLISEKHDGTRVFKTTYSYRILSPSIGSIYLIDRQLYEIVHVDNNEVTLLAIKGKGKKTMKRHELLSMYVANKVKVLSQNQPII